MGQSPSTDGMLCLPRGGPSLVTSNPTTGVDNVAREEVHRVQSWVDMLEQKVQLSLAPLATEHGPLQPPGPLIPAAGPYQFSE